MIFQSFQGAVASVQSSSDVHPLYLNTATLVPLPSKIFRHNCPSRAHTVTKHVRSLSSGSDEFVVVSVTTLKLHI